MTTGASITTTTTSQPGTATTTGSPAVADTLHQLVQAVGCGGVDKVGVALEKVIEGVLEGKIAPDARARIGKAMALVLSGRTWGDAIDEAGVSWAMIHAWGRACPAYRDLLAVVRESGESALHAKRVQAAHKRAIDGVLEPVFQGGEHVGDVLRYSDRLMELLLKGGDPARYNPQATGASGGQAGQAGPIAIQINISTAAPADKGATFTVESATNASIPQDGQG